MRSLLVYLLMLLSGLAFSDTLENRQFVPAHFGKGENSLLANLECPENHSDKNTIILFCQATVDTNGEVKRKGSFCFSQDYNARNFARESRIALRKSTFMPASIDGVNTEVYFSFRIFFSFKDEDCNIIAVPNFGYHQDKFGMEYFSPQEVVGDRTWLSRSRGLGQGGSGGVWANSRGIMFAMSVAVSTDGEASDARIENRGFATRRQLHASLVALGKSHFIPGFYKGKKTSMRYFEILYLDPS